MRRIFATVAAALLTFAPVRTPATAGGCPFTVVEVRRVARPDLGGWVIVGIDRRGCVRREFTRVLADNPTGKSWAFAPGWRMASQYAPGEKWVVVSEYGRKVEYLDVP